MWLFYSIIINITFLIFVPSFEVLAFDLLCALGPIIFNLIWIYIPDQYKIVLIPNGWPQIVFIVVIGIFIALFGGFIIFQTIDIFTKNSELDFPSILFSFNYIFMDSFLILFYLITCI